MTIKSENIVHSNSFLLNYVPSRKIKTGKNTYTSIDNIT